MFELYKPTDLLKKSFILFYISGTLLRERACGAGCVFYYPISLRVFIDLSVLVQPLIMVSLICVG